MRGPRTASASQAMWLRRVPAIALIVVSTIVLSGSQMRGWPSEEVRRQFRAAEANASQLVKTNPEEGVKARQEMLAWSIRLFGPDHDETAVAEHNLGFAYERLARYDLALPRFQRATELHLRNWGRRNVNVGKSLLTLGACYNGLGQYARAEEALLAARQILSEVGDESSRSMASFDLAIVYQNERRFPEALKLLFEEHSWRLRTRGPLHWSVANLEKQIGELYATMGDFANGERMVRSAIAISVKRQKVPRSAYFGVLALNLIGLGKYDEAWEAARTFYGDMDTRAPWELASEVGPYAVTLMGVACAYRGSRCTEAAALMDRAVRLHRRSSATLLANLPEGEQLTYLGTVDETLQDALSLAVSRSDPSLAERSAEWLLNGKARLHESMAQRTLLLRDATDPKLQSISGELRRVRQQIATLVHSAPGDAAQQARQIQGLQQQEEELSRRLAQVGGRSGSDSRWFELKNLKAAIPAESVLIDIARISVRNYRAKSGVDRQDRYIAWVTHPAARSQPVRVIDLGDARVIDAGVKRFQDALTQFDKAVQQLQELKAREFPIPLERKLEASFRDASSALARLVVDPLRPAIGSTRNWIVSPDGNLWAIPWATLWQGDAATGRYLIQDHPTSYVVSGRDLLEVAPRVQTTAPVVFADPDYDLGVAAARQQTTALLGTRAVQPGPTTSRPLMPSGAAGRLPDTAREAVEIKADLAKWARAEPIVYLDARAVEGVFKAVRSPRVVYLSTHGFFWELPGRTDKYRAGTDLLENPLLRCGLLLASCNRREARQPSDDDGILTGAEIVGTDLRGTELAVLSACQTGLGDVWAGQSAAGLRQAFQLAGARSVLASLWYVPSNESVDVMKGFFKNLAEGQSSVDALNNSERKFFELRQTKRNTAHPYFWGTFTLTGQFR